jgi:hypothetical protein
MEEYMQKKGEKLVAEAPTPLLNGYCPEIDLSPELEARYSLLSLSLESYIG